LGRRFGRFAVGGLDANRFEMRTSISLKQSGSLSAQGGAIRQPWSIAL
jgi:hypothetical protein